MSAIHSTIINDLLEKAKKAGENAYSPYSKIKVGAALLSESGIIYTGCNVENASYGLTICAERNAIFSAIQTEGPEMKVKAIAITMNNDFTPYPCGACRQVIAEFSKLDSDGGTQIIFENKGKINIENISTLLPFTFELKK